MTDDEHLITPDAAEQRDPMAGHVVPEPSAAMPPVASGQPLYPTAKRRGRSWARWIVWGSLGAFVLAVLVLSRINLNYYAIQPGSAQPVQPYIKVPASKSHPVPNPILLTDVREARVNALNYLFFKLQSDTVLYSVPSVTGGTSPSELDAQGALQMSQAEASAKTAALRYLGYTVTANPSGAVIAGTFPGTPADGVLNVGDVVTAVDGKATLTALELTHALASYRSGQSVVFTVRKGGTGPTQAVSLTLKRTTVDIGGRSVQLDLGILPQDQVDYTYPFPISINVTNIGGPSAGLAMTLGVIDTLSGGQLTGGRTVAATGTMDAAGSVGDVGGVPQKTVAVENAKASIFLVPPGEYADAKSKQKTGLKIFPVSTLAQALRVLADNGGHVATSALVASTSGGAA